MSSASQIHPLTSSSAYRGPNISIERLKPPMREKLPDTGGGDEAKHVSELDVRKKQVFHGSSAFSSSPSYDDLLGALSLNIWTITLMVSVKYVAIVLRADDEGEGGTFAIYSLLSKYVRQFSVTAALGV
ncbi:MAG: hypothetical protein Q9188_006271 [Gyalolechia gomerana]